jgi:hypothetical protein
MWFRWSTSTPGRKKIGQTGLFWIGAHRERRNDAVSARFSTRFAVEVFQSAAEAFLAADHFEGWNVVRRIGFAGQRNVADSLVRAFVMVMGGQEKATGTRHARLFVNKEHSRP